jgi:hypothetical protein
MLSCAGKIAESIDSYVPKSQTEVLPYEAIVNLLTIALNPWVFKGEAPWLASKRFFGPAIEESMGIVPGVVNSDSVRAST